MSDIDTVVVDSLKVLDPDRPIREADIRQRGGASIGDVEAEQSRNDAFHLT